MRQRLGRRGRLGGSWGRPGWLEERWARLETPLWVEREGHGHLQIEGALAAAATPTPRLGGGGEHEREAVGALARLCGDAVAPEDLGGGPLHDVLHLRVSGERAQAR